MTSSAVFIPSSKGSRALQGREGRSSCFLHLDLMGLWFMVVPGGMLCTAASNTAHCFAVSCTSLPQGKHERQTRSTWHPFAYFWSLSNLLVSIAEQRGTVVMENPGKKKWKKWSRRCPPFSTSEEEAEQGKQSERKWRADLSLLLGIEVSVQREMAGNTGREEMQPWLR